MTDHLVMHILKSTNDKDTFYCEDGKINYTNDNRIRINYAETVLVRLTFANIDKLWNDDNICVTCLVRCLVND